MFPAECRRVLFIRDVLTNPAQDVSGAIEAVAQGSANDPGGFSQLEVVRCAWKDDVDSVLQVDDDSWVLAVDPAERLGATAFSLLRLSGAIKAGSPVRRIGRAGKLGNQRSASILAEPVLDRKLKRTGKFRASLPR